MQIRGDKAEPRLLASHFKLIPQPHQHAHVLIIFQMCLQIIDARHKGNNSRYINHSCDPNCETQKWYINGILRIGFFTLREIKGHEELTFDYQYQRFGYVRAYVKKQHLCVFLFAVIFDLKSSPSEVFL